MQKIYHIPNPLYKAIMSIMTPGKENKFYTNNKSWILLYIKHLYYKYMFYIIFKQKIYKM